MSHVAVRTTKGTAVTSLRLFLNSRIVAPAAPGSLLGGLTSATPPVGSTATNSQLDTLAANSAINAAETASLNAVGSIRSGAYSGNLHLYEK